MESKQHQPGPAPIRLISFLLALVLALPLPFSALASAAPPDLSLSAELGWGNTLIPERWCPINITITGPGGIPLKEAFDGDIIITYPQDATQQTALRIHIAGTPGRVATATGVICVPRSIDRLSIKLQGSGGADMGEVVYARYANTDAGEIPLPNLSSIGAMQAVSDGSAKLPSALLQQWRPTAMLYDPSVRVRCDTLPPAAFPIVSAAYDSLTFLIVDAASPIDSRAKAAIREWVLSGGRLVVIAAKPGSEWRTWLPPGPAGDLLTVGVPVVAPPCPGILEAAGKALPALPAQAGGTSPPATTRALPQAAASITMRPLRLTDRAANDGWKLRWPLPDQSPSALIAEGPVGFGFVTVLGAEPRRCVTPASDDDAEAIWHEALKEILADEVPDAGNSTPDYSYYTASSGSTRNTARALAGILDSLANVPALDSRVFITITIAMILLAIMLGPGDYLLLRRPTRRHRSWLTAIIWIGVASALAFAGPSFLRDSQSSLHRFTVIDAIQARGDGRALAYQTGITSIWAGAPLHTTINTPTPPPDGQALVSGSSDSAHWRGVSAVATSWYADSAFLIPTAQFLQRPPSIDQPDDPWGGIPPSLESCTHPETQGLYFRPWTLRAFSETARVHLPMFATLADWTGTPTIRLGGIPAGATIKNAAARVGDKWYVLTFGPSPGGRTSGPQDLTAVLGEPLVEKAGDGQDLAMTPIEGPAWSSKAIRVLPQSDSLTRRWMSGAFSLPGVARRTQSIYARADGRWLTLYLQIEGLPPDRTLAAPATTTHSSMIRLLVPLP